MAPEVVIDDKYTPKCDLWSVGVLTFCLLTGRFPFNDEEEDEDYIV